MHLVSLVKTGSSTKYVSAAGHGADYTVMITITITITPWLQVMITITITG